MRFMNDENESDFESSRRSVFKEIMDEMKDDGVEMIGIWGMAGIGNTFLVKRVAKYAKDEGLFEEVAMAVVSQKPRVKAIQYQIADRICWKFITRIFFKARSLWCNSLALPSGDKSCKIILTSRILDVCEQMRTRKNFKIDLLSAREALSLFLQMSGVDDQFSEKGRLAENLSEECGRLPILIVIVARGLLNKELCRWTDMLNQLRKSGPESRVRDIFELSYNDYRHINFLCPATSRRIFNDIWDEDETSMASSSNSECLEDKTLSSKFNGGEQKQIVIGVGGIGQISITNSKFENNFQFSNSTLNLKLDSVSLPAPPLPIGFTNDGNKFDFESRKSGFKEIIDAIKDDGVQMIGIWGMPGIGKSFLVERVAKYAQDEGLFEVVAMAVVSQNPNVQAIQDGIADRIGLNLTCKSDRGRADQLRPKLLAKKKILVILDDIWDSSLVLNDIGIPSGSQHKGCKIILTSRRLDVCEQMRTENNFKIDPLSENEALGLFLQKSGIDDRSSEIGQLAEKLSKECGGLPLAIVIVARVLLNKELNDWTDMLNPLRNSDLENKVQDAIELSYNKVERQEEKMFFLLCALFPEDFEIPVPRLFEYGIGLNLFEKVNNVDQALVRAHKLASMLKSSCLLLDVRSYEGSENFVKMHDVVRDAALAIASRGNIAFLVRSEAQWTEWPEKTAISLWRDDLNKLPDALECPQLQILILNCLYPKWHLPDNFFTGMKNLIVLDIKGMECVRLPQSFACLVNLRTLRLSKCRLGDISTIGKLQNLVSLSFYDSDIKVLPKEIGKLGNLRLLDFSSSDNLTLGLKVITPGVIQNLSQLEVLYMGRNVLRLDAKEYFSPKNGSFLELIHLSRLMILEICIPKVSMLPDEVLFVNLTKFKISIGYYFYKMKQNFCSSSQLLQLGNVSENELTKAGIKMLMKKAQRLELENVSGISVALPSHLGGFRTLKELLVSCCKDVNYAFDMNKSEYEPETPSLQLLHLFNLPFLKEISKGEFPSLSVSKLEHLRLHELPRLVHLWQFNAKYVALANLTFMSVKSCDKLKYIFEHNSAKSLSKLKELEVEKCKNLQAIFLTKEQNNDIDFPQLSHLKLSELENLTSFGSKFTLESTLFGEQVIFRALEKLNINNLQKLEKIWHIHTLVESFFQLKVLKLTQCSELLIVFPPQATSALRNLEEICIENCDKLETLFSLDDVPLTVGDEMVHFQLKFLKLTQCPQLLVVFPPQATLTLRNLEEICIENCDKLETLFQSDDVPLKFGNEMILFPRLLTLKLVNLPKFTAILSTTSENISQATEIFSTMKIMTLCRLHNLESIVDQQLLTFFPKLKKLQLVDIGCISSTADQLHIIKGLEALEELIIQDNKCR